MDLSDEAEREVNCTDKDTTESSCGNKCQKPNSSPSAEEKIEVIKVYLEPSRRRQQKNHHSTKMQTDEVTQIQEVRYCLKTLREQMAARTNNKFPTNGIRVTVPVSRSPDPKASPDVDASESRDEECMRLTELTKRLYAQLQEVEKRHQEEKEALQAENLEYQRRLKEQNERVLEVQSKAEEQERCMEELQRFLGDLEEKNTSLRDKMAADEAALKELQALKDGEEGKRCKELENELAVKKEKHHHLDDMLKSQQRKVRHMIEQLQKAGIMMEERGRVIGDLEEKVAFLEAENREMRDRLEVCLGDQTSSSLTSEREAQIVYSKALTPTSSGNKSLPFIKVIETKS
ncbi:tuftelin 1b isoform X2 [Trichomycterus rosablanca]|uniref:tuftelin 1b isoform X2 n=1 Tax=Trichomycterus rosablanca TaxID=2290929 RepID=UPI002F360F45